ncbi:MAG: ABC transporter permease [Actinomycetota bacterium]
MKGMKALFLKDWKLIYRNRLLFAVLIIYPFIIMGVIGAAFSGVGRPVPIALVNLDSADAGEIAWTGVKTAEAEGLERRFRRRGVRANEYADGEEAVASLAAGQVNSLLAVATEGGAPRWLGAELTAEEIAATLLDLESEADEWHEYATAGEATSSLREGRDTVLFAVPEEEYPYLGETIWLEDQNFDALGLVTEFGQDVTEIEVFASGEEAREALRQGRADAVIVLPRGFVHSLKTLDEVAQVPVIIDQSNLVKAEFAETSIRGFLSRIKDGVVENKTEAVVAGLYVLVSGGDFFGTEVVGLQQIRDNLLELNEALADRPDLQEKVEVGIDLADTVIGDIEEAAAYLRGTALPIALEVSSVAGRPLSAKDAVVPSLIALSILWTGVLCGAILMVVEYEEGMRTRLGLTEMGPLSLVGSKLLLATAVVFVQSAVMLALAVAVFGAFSSNAPLSLLIIAAASFSCIGIGLVIAAFARQVAAAVILSVLVCFPLIFMTGVVFPLSQMPAFMQWIARAIPLTYAVEALAGVMLRGETLADVLWQLVALAAFGAGLLTLGSILVRRRSI